MTLSKYHLDDWYTVDKETLLADLKTVTDKSYSELQMILNECRIVGIYEGHINFPKSELIEIVRELIELVSAMIANPPTNKGTAIQQQIEAERVKKDQQWRKYHNIQPKEQSMITAFDLNSSQVKDLVKGQVPPTFSDWYIICATGYTAKYGDKYQILAICDDTTCKTSTMFLDVICDDNFNYVTFGSENYNQTLEIANRHSLIADVDRFLTLT